MVVMMVRWRLVPWNSAGNAGNAGNADKAGKWIWSLGVNVFATPSCLHQHPSALCLNSHKKKSGRWLAEAGKGGRKTLGAASNPLPAFSALAHLSQFLARKGDR